MDSELCVLVLGDTPACSPNLAERLRLLGQRSVEAKTPQDAIDLAELRGYRFGAALLAGEWPAIDLGAALDEIRWRTRSEDMRAVAAGPRPDAARRSELRQAGVRLAAWDPVDDHVLRFQVNRALQGPEVELLRVDERVPGCWKAIVVQGQRVKPVEVYTLSGGGSFLQTPRPSQAGARIGIQIQLPHERVTLRAEVLYTNVPGNLQRPNLPHGMGVRFADVSGEKARALRAAVRTHAADLLV